ncbi:transposase [Xanthomonas euvesicatoria]|uniref:transposase n=1 Tax=Xanthomonas citri TaxID=346 RepID=UPI0026B4C1D6|nr:transposase [Xanthomonas euvesicatoria]
MQRSARPVASTGSASRPNYVWKSKYAGMEVSQLRHLKDVEAELARMKRMYAELALDHHALKDVLSRKG